MGKYVQLNVISLERVFGDEPCWEQYTLLAKWWPHQVDYEIEVSDVGSFQEFMNWCEGDYARIEWLLDHEYIEEEESESSEFIVKRGDVLLRRETDHLGAPTCALVCGPSDDRYILVDLSTGEICGRTDGDMGKYLRRSNVVKYTRAPDSLASALKHLATSTLGGSND